MIQGLNVLFDPLSSLLHKTEKNEKNIVLCRIYFIYKGCIILQMTFLDVPPEYALNQIRILKILLFLPLCYFKNKIWLLLLSIMSKTKDLQFPLCEADISGVVI